MPLERAVLLPSPAESVSVYILFDSAKKRFLLQRERDQGSTPREKWHRLHHEKGAINNAADVDKGV